MKKQTLFNVAAVTAGILLSGGNLVAADQNGQNQNQGQYNQNLSQNQSGQQFAGQTIRASKLIGKSVKDPQGQTACEIRDLVVDLNTGNTRYAIVNAGGVAGMGGKKIAVPINAIQASSDGTLTISASKQDLENASTTPSGAWASTSGQEWTQGVEGYYGEPQLMNNRFERESPQSPGFGREPVRNDMSQPPQSGDQPKAAEQEEMNGQTGASQYGNQQAPASTAALQDSINQTILQNYGQDTANGVHASVNNSQVTLTGTVDSQSTKDSIENKVQSLPGVTRVDDQLQVKQNQQ